MKKLIGILLAFMLLFSTGIAIYAANSNKTVRESDSSTDTATSEDKKNTDEIVSPGDSGNSGENANSGDSENSAENAGSGNSGNSGENAGSGDSTNSAENVNPGDSENSGENAGSGDSENSGENAGSGGSESSKEVVTYSTNGMTLTYTEEIAHSKGVLYPNPMGEIDEGICGTAFYYFALPREEFETLIAKDDLTDEEMHRLIDSEGLLLHVLSIDSGRGESDITAFLDAQNIGAENRKLTELGRAEDVTFYIFDAPKSEEAYLAAMDPEYAEDFKVLKSALQEVLKNAEFFVPLAPGSELIGQTLHFETTDIDGNPVKSEDIFKENDLTMINIWATWCGPCINELKGLGEMHRRLAEKNAAVIGLCADADTELDECKSLLKENNVDYLNILPFDGMDDALAITAYPTSFFVDSSGKILSAPMVGAPEDMSKYENFIDGLLRGEAASKGTGAAVQENDVKKYRVIVSDNEGNKVQGAMVQFCSDTECKTEKTDESGVASFEAEKGVYTVHVLKAPDGYEENTEEITTLETYSDIFIVLQKTGSKHD